MIISDRYRFLFIHIPKTGGTSLNLALSPYGRMCERLAYQGSATPGVRRLLMMATGGDVVRKLTGFQAHASYHHACEGLGAERVKGLFSFAVTRNPFTRAVSYYRHCQRVADHDEHDLAMRAGFSDFVLELLERHREAFPPAKRFTQSQYVWNPETREIVVDALLSFERFSEDVREVETRLGLPKPLKLQTLNQAPRAAEDIAALFGEALDPFVESLSDDFERLGYSTDISKLSEPPGRSSIYCQKVPLPEA